MLSLEDFEVKVNNQLYVYEENKIKHCDVINRRPFNYFRSCH